jgi:dipeptidyl-peptidase-4
MKRLHFVALAIVAFSSFAAAQDKLLTLDDVFSPDAKVRVQFGGRPSGVQWSQDGLSFKQTINGRLMRVDARSGSAVPYYDSGSLSTALVRTAGMKSEDANTAANSPTLLFNATETAVLLNSGGELWYYDIDTRNLRKLTNNREDEVEADFSPDGKWVSFVRHNDLFVVNVANSNEKQLTRDGHEGAKAIYNGYLDWVYEEELYGRGQKRGYWWSPDSRFIAFLRTDESPVPKFVIPNDIPTDQAVENTDYPQAGDPNPTVKLGIADVGKAQILPSAGRIPRIGEKLPPMLQRLGDSARFVDLAAYKPEDMLIARVAWAPDSKTILFQALNREQTFLDLNAAGLDGKVRKILNETTPAWVEVYDNPMFVDGSGSPDGATFVWQSARNGFRHLYLYNNDGQLVRQLTNGKWEVRNLYGVDSKNGWAYFSATKDSSIAENIYRVHLTGGEPERLSKGDGTHSASFNKTFTQYAESWSDVLNPAQTRLFNADGSMARVINENKVEAMSQYRLGTPEFMSVKTRDGFEMNALMIRPPDFDPNKKYPVLEFTYSGPHAPQVANKWGGTRYLWFHMLAEKGYIVWICDNRSASGKGEESVWPVYKNLGPLELRDLEDGVAYLKTLAYIDGSRIALHGWSYGGFMTSYAMTHSNVWKLGIAGGTVADWRNYDSIYTERYMLTPQDNRDGYDKTSVLKAAANLSGKLLLIHGGIDNNVHLQNTTELSYELQKADKQFDLMIYPTARHGLTNQAQIKHWYTMMTDYLQKNL